MVRLESTRQPKGDQGVHPPKYKFESGLRCEGPWLFWADSVQITFRIAIVAQSFTCQYAQTGGRLAPWPPPRREEVGLEVCRDNWVTAG